MTSGDYKTVYNKILKYRLSKRKVDTPSSAKFRIAYHKPADLVLTRKSQYTQFQRPGDYPILTPLNIHPRFFIVVFVSSKPQNSQDMISELFEKVSDILYKQTL